MGDRVQIGAYCTLTVASQGRLGLTLRDDEGGEALLPQAQAPEGARVGSRLKVFIHTDIEGEALATTSRPLALLGEFACLRCTDVNSQGAFLDWGLPKDLFVPFAEQHVRMVSGRDYVVAICRAERKGRLMASSKLARHFDYDTGDVEVGDEVSLIVYGRRDNSVRVIVDGRYSGMIYADRSFRRLPTGHKLTGFVRVVRGDNKLEIVLTKQGREGIDEASERILDELHAAGGAMSVHDKSSPELIAARFDLSKKVFKRAVGALLKSSTIRLTGEGIALTDSGEPEDG